MKNNKTIKDKKSEYLNYLDLKDTKVFINGNYVKDDKKINFFWGILNQIRDLQGIMKKEEMQILKLLVIIIRVK